MESHYGSSTAANSVNGVNEAMLPQLVFQKGAAVTGSSHSVSRTYLESKAVIETRALAADLCRHFYTLGWLSGTGGSITIKVHDDSVSKAHQLLVMSPSGVQKERMVADDMYVLSSDGFIVLMPPLKPYPHHRYRCTDCSHVFMKIYEMCDAGAVIHSHGMEACIATMMNPLAKEFRITHMEMMKGIQGHGYHDELVLPIIENTAHERELTESVIGAIRDYPKATAVLVRNHGVYIWGDTWISAKTQAECYHYLFDAAINLRRLGLDWSIPSHGPIGFGKVCGCKMNSNRGLKAGSLGLDYMIEPSHHCILLNIEGTITPVSFISNILMPYANDNVEKHLAATYDSVETQDDISLLRSQIQSDLDGGVVGATPIPSHCVGRDSVIASLVVNVEAMIRSNRKVTAIEQLLGHIWRTGFLNNELVGFVYDDVPEALQRWHAAGIKVYIYSSCSREAQQLLLANSNFGNIRKYFRGFFDTTVGNKDERHSYIEIMRTVGVDRPADMLFVTDVFEEALAARAAGLEVIISIRPGNGPLPENRGFRMLESLLEI